MKIDPIKILLTVIAIVLLIMVGSNIYYDEVVRPSRIRKLKNSADSIISAVSPMSSTGKLCACKAAIPSGCWVAGFGTSNGLRV